MLGKLKKNAFLALITVTFWHPVDLKAQITVSPVKNFRNEVKVTDFLSFLVSNMDTEPRQLYFKVLIHIHTGELIAEGLTNEVTLTANHQGYIQGLTYTSFIYKNAAYASLIRKSNGSLPPGTYRTDIIAFNRVGNTELTSESIETEIELMNPPVLVTPFHREELQMIYPTFTWLPPAPVSPSIDLTYEIKVVEIRNGQTPQTAILSNPVVYRQHNLRSLRLNYPISSYRFDKTKEYAWQITAFAEGIYIGRSETWLFRFGESEKKEERANVGQSYILLKKGSNSGVYLAINSLKFKFIEEYNSGELSFEFKDSENRIIELTDPEKQLKQPGPNLYEIDLYDEEQFESGSYYSLEVKSEKQEVYKIYFKYIRKMK